MTSPLSSTAIEPSDEDLLARGRSGDREALEQLLVRHQPWVLNIAVRMLWNRADAEDATQDVLIKVLRALSTYRSESLFRTWLYRIAVNHILDLRRQGWSVSMPRRSFAERARTIAEVPDLELPDPRTVPVPLGILVDEAKISCMTALLLCLDGRQRLVFILGEILGATDEVGAEIVGVTAANFRQILSRARRDTYQYLNGHCSLVNTGASCRCVRKTRAFLESGKMDPVKRMFTPEYRRRVREMAPARADELALAYEAYGANVYRDHPFYESPDPVAQVRQALAALSPDLLSK